MKMDGLTSIAMSRIRENVLIRAIFVQLPGYVCISTEIPNPKTQSPLQNETRYLVLVESNNNKRKDFASPDAC